MKVYLLLLYNEFYLSVSDTLYISTLFCICKKASVLKSLFLLG